MTTLSLPLLLGLSLAYLTTLFVVGQAADRNWIPRRISEHPLTWLLSLGLFFGVWGFFGTVGLAYALQGGFLTFFLGVSLAFLALPVLIQPLMRITQNYQLGSLADLMAFRFRSRWAGTLVTLALTLVIMPLFALQIQAVTGSLSLLLGTVHEQRVAIGFIILVLLFTAFVGANQLGQGRRSGSLVMTLATDGLLRLLVFLGLGAFIAWQVFQDPLDMWQWQTSQTARHALLGESLGLTTGLTLVFMFALSPVVLPHLFHLLVREQPGGISRRWLQFGMPVYALLFALPVLPVLWAGLRLGFPSLPEYFALSIGQQLSTPWLSATLFVMVVSAAVTTLLVSTLALASMWINHGLLPYAPPRRESSDIYHWLLWARRGLTMVILLCGLGFYGILQTGHSLTSLGMLSFVSALQLLPGLVGLLYWQRASRTGLMASLATGMGLWLILLGLPLVVEAHRSMSSLPLYFETLASEWFLTTLLTLAANALVFVVFSLWFPPSTEEQAAASACSQNAPMSPSRRALRAHNAREFVAQLAGPLGQVTAEREVEKALKELGYTLAEYRPFALRNLRDRLEINLSGLMGPSVANTLVERYLAIDPTEIEPATEDLYLVENRLEGLHNQLTGMARELDQLRRFHRDTLMRLPIGVFSLAQDGEILLWNQVMAQLTGIPAEQALGARLGLLPAPWRSLLEGFVDDSHQDAALLPMDEGDQRRWLNLHKSSAPQSPGLGEPASMVVLVDDQTQTKMLEEELVHSERLAAIGSLSAGVAHEIGNPITGIDSLAQELRYLSSEPDVQEVADQIRDQAWRVTTIVQSLVSYAHAGLGRRQDEHSPHRLQDVVQDAINLLQLSKGARPVVLLNEVPADIMVPCDPQRLGQVFINLLTNARDASASGDEILVTAEADRHRVQVAVLDHGKGIPPEVRDRILEPFFTTKEVGKGTGLGLSLASNIIEEHYGSLDIESPAFQLEGRGTRVIITLPRFMTEVEATP
ncbi:PAS domain-containing protein [Natronospirillum operosum]|uniref:histidine kinase n=1 Tax=Natronospirillum operosum TaxID=2759953 RepID=A0A4Z0WA33_9GAMM|nr:ATP-binding protein [Natronospirillum operosum]TGG94069.1 PAS domain-containing protein [Natronospirillum operosum]